MQGYKGIGQWPINLFSPNDYTQNYYFCILPLMVQTFGHTTKGTNLLE